MKLLTMTILASSILCTSIYADSASFTLKEAQQYCPAANTKTSTSITFTADRPSDPYSAGYFSGEKIGRTFKSNHTSAPADLSTVINKNHSSTGEYYGYKSGNNIVCFYQYTSKVAGPDVYLNLSTGPN